MSPATSDFDVLVIGAGPAGSSAACRTAAAGLRTILVEREHFPRFRIGESLLPAGNELLREIGAWPRIEAAGFIPKYGASFHLADGSQSKTVVFSQGLVPDLDHTYQVERARFDNLLFDHARARGAKARAGATVRSVESDSEGYLVKLDSTYGAETIRARWVIDASGRDQFFPSALKDRLDPPRAPKRIAIYSHFTGVPRPDGPEAGDTVIVRLADGWFWIIPIDAKRTSVGLVTETATLRASGLKPEAYFRQAVLAAPKLRTLMHGAVPVLDFHVTSDYTYFRRDLAADRFLLVGDAGGFFDPIFSSGVYLALYSAKLAAEKVIEAESAGRALTSHECRNYTRVVKAHAGVFQKLITAFYDNASFAVFMSPKPPLGMAPAITSIVAGHSSLEWPIWWRFQAFRLVCWLQRRFTLVPEPGSGESLPPARPAGLAP